MQTPAGLKPLFKLGLAGLHQCRASGRFSSSTCFVYWESSALLCRSRLGCSTEPLLGFSGENSAGLQDGAVGSVLAPLQHPPHHKTPSSPSKPAPGVSPHPCHPITPMDPARPAPPSVSKESQPPVVSPPSFPCRLFFSPSPPSIKQQICFQSNKTAVQPLEQMFSARLRAQGRRGDSH